MTGGRDENMCFRDKHFPPNIFENSLLNYLFSGNPVRVCSSQDPQDGLVLAPRRPAD
jgi:hypothetical protein